MDGASLLGYKFVGIATNGMAKHEDCNYNILIYYNLALQIFVLGRLCACKTDTYFCGHTYIPFFGALIDKFTKIVEKILNRIA